MQKTDRLRKNQKLRELFKEIDINIEKFIMPVFIKEGKDIEMEFQEFKGIYRYSIDRVGKLIEEILKYGLKNIILFGIPEKKEKELEKILKNYKVVFDAIRYIKKNYPEILIITDICVCSYTETGQCGIWGKNGIDEIKTLNVLSQIALGCAESGAEIISPSAKTSGQVKKIREILDKNGFLNIPIMSYSGKFASNLYFPFRYIAESFPKVGDRKSYQIPYTNINEALKDIEKDIQEGTDIVMIKPALFYLDVISKTKEKFNVPVCAYNVSGEYVMLKYLGKFVEEKEIVFEAIYSILRSGADIIISYYSLEIAKWLNQKI